MSPHILRYTLDVQEVARNEELLAALFAELEEVQPDGLRYAAFKLADGVTFAHFIWLEKNARPSPLVGLTALQAFHGGLRDRCISGPTRTELSPVGSFRLFA